MNEMPEDIAKRFFILGDDGTIRYRHDWLNAQAGERIRSQMYVRILNANYDVASIRNILEKKND